MDTSEQYIKMCDCPEIQKQKPKGNEFIISYKNPNIWIEHEGSFLYATHDVWLPRQDQIQEMMEGHKKPHYLIISLVNFMQDQQTFYKSGKIKEKYLTGSMEQLWLAFYMFEKHKKTWEDEKWVKK